MNQQEAEFLRRLESNRQSFENSINALIASLVPRLTPACASSPASGVEDCANVPSPLKDGDSKPVLFGRLPLMTDPYGTSWGQPKGLRDRVEIYFSHAVISERDWEALPNYKTSMPSGVYAGKVWRCGKFLRWYGRPHKIIERGQEVEVCSTGHIRALVTA